MNSEIKELNLELMFKYNEINKIIELYNLELELALSVVDNLVSLDKVKFIEKNFLRYALDNSYKEFLNNYNFEAPIKTKEILGKYFEEMEKNKLKQNYKLDKERNHEKKLSKLRKGNIENNQEIINGCYIENKLVGYIKYLENDKEILITEIYSDLRGEGIGTKLINTINKEKNIKIKIISNNTARFMYEKLGFKYIEDNIGRKNVDNYYTMIKKQIINKKKDNVIIKK